MRLVAAHGIWSSTLLAADTNCEHSKTKNCKTNSLSSIESKTVVGLGLQPGQPAAVAPAAEQSQCLVAAELAAADGEDKWAADQASPLLLATTGRGAFAPPDVWPDAAAKPGAAGAARVALRLPSQNREPKEVGLSRV